MPVGEHANVRRDATDVPTRRWQQPVPLGDVGDTAVNEGPGKAVLFLQRALGIAADEHFGIATALAMRKMGAKVVRMLKNVHTV